MKQRLIILVTVLLVLVTPKDASALYLRNDIILWPGGVVPVCWASNINPESSLPKTIRQAVENTWGYFGNVTFQGWGRCPVANSEDMPDGNIIFIEKTGGRSHATFGAVFLERGGNTRCTKEDPVIFCQPRPSVMFLNFDASWLCDLVPEFGYSN